jgi:hypothetical protein
MYLSSDIWGPVPLVVAVGSSVHFVSYDIMTLVDLTSRSVEYIYYVKDVGSLMARTVVNFVQNGYFLLLAFVTGMFYFSFYLVALTLGLSLAVNPSSRMCPTGFKRKRCC